MVSKGFLDINQGERIIIGYINLLIHIFLGCLGGLILIRRLLIMGILWILGLLITSHAGLDLQVRPASTMIQHGHLAASGGSALRASDFFLDISNTMGINMFDNEGLMGM